jgi:hypothetical protein
MARGAAAVVEVPKPKSIVVARKPMAVASDADAAVKPKPEAVAAIVDEFGALEVKLDALKKLQDRRDELRTIICGWYEGADSTSIFRPEGKLFDLEVSPRGMEREIVNMPALFRRLGQQVFLKLCKFSLARLDEHVAPVEQAQFISSSQTGPRRVKAIQKLTPAN